MHDQALEAKIQNRTANIGVVGLGYVGLPLMRAFWDAGLAVTGFDVDSEKIELLRRGECYLRHFGPQFVADMAQSEQFQVSADPAILGHPDVLLICVPTPLDRHLQPNLDYVSNTTRTIAQVLRPGQLVVLESTTYPGTTRELMVPLLETARGPEGNQLRADHDFFVGFSPEREDPGRTSHSTRDIPKVVGGLSERSGELARKVYELAFTHVVPVSSCEVAEAAKLLENIYRAVNIALVNEMKVVLSDMDIDVWEVIDAAATKPFGFHPFYPGPGLGGHCIPIDPYYLTWKAKEHGISTRFIELAGEVNRMMPTFVVRRTMLALNDRGLALKGAKVLVLGLAYKPDVDDVRESPSFTLIEQFQQLGAKVDYHDPFVPHTKQTREHDLKMESIELSDQALASYDCVVVATNHQDYDWARIGQVAQLVIDTRGALRHLKLPEGRVVGA